MELIDSYETERLFTFFEERMLYTPKADIYGCCVKLLTESEYVKDRWEENFYMMGENIRSHGRLIVMESPDEALSVKYDPHTRTAFLVNVDYYGWIKSIALAVAGDVLEDEHRIYSVHGAAIDVGGEGVSLIAPSGTGKTTHSWGLLRLSKARLVSDDWYFVRLSDREPLAFRSEKNCYIEAEIGKIWGEYEQLVEKARLNDKGRAVVNVRWIVGQGGVLPLTTMKKIVLLKRDKDDSSIVKELSGEEALQYLLKNDFCNPHLLVKDKRKLKLRKKFFQNYLKHTSTYMVNTVEPAGKVQEEIQRIVNA